MAISKRDLKLILYLVGLVAFVVLYFVPRSNLNNEAADIRAQADELKPRLEELRAHEAQVPAYEASIQADKAYIDETAELYPNDVREETNIMYAVNLEKSVGLDVSSVSLASVSSIAEMSKVGDETPILGYVSKMTMNMTLSYAQLKAAVKYVTDTYETTTIDSVSMSYDSSTGGLYGSIAVNKYFITGLDNEYYETGIPSMNMGTSNIFGTLIVEDANADTDTNGD